MKWPMIEVDIYVGNVGNIIEVFLILDNYFGIFS